VSERNTALGSVPAYTVHSPAGRRRGPTATAMIVTGAIPGLTGAQLRPAFRLRKRPARVVPQ
jgi:hypothetical protein